MEYIKVMPFNAFQTNKESFLNLSVLIKQDVYFPCLFQPGLPWKGSASKSSVWSLSPLHFLASHFFSAFTDINNYPTIRMFGWQRELINSGFMDCLLMEARKAWVPSDREVFGKLWNVFSGIFGICKCQESRFFSCQLSQCDSQLEPSALHSSPQGHWSFFTHFLLLTGQFLLVSFHTSTSAPPRDCNSLVHFFPGESY